MPDSPLPHGLPDGLHILEPSASLGWLWWLLAILLILWWLWRRRRRPSAEPPPPRETEKASVPRPAADGLQASLEKLRRRHLASRDYRKGCHELAKAVRGHLEDESGEAEPETLTARELASRFQKPIARLVLWIADLQWRRRDPTRDEFEKVCTLAVEVLKVTEGRRQ